MHRHHLAAKSILIAPILALVMVGCTAPPAPDPTAEQFRLVGAGDAIQLSVEGLPVDQQSEDPSHLTLASATQRALSASPEIQAALARARIALADARQERLLPNPVFNIAIRFPSGGGDNIIEAGLSEDLLSLLTMSRRVSSADHRLRAATAEVLVTVLDTFADVQEKYLAVQAADAAIAVLEDRRKLIDRLYQIALARVEAGEAPRLDSISVEADRAALDVEIDEQLAEQRQRRLELARLIGEPSGAAGWKLDAWSAQDRAVLDERALLGAAFTHRPEVQARRWELAALGDDLELAGWGAFDGLEIGAEAEREGDWSVGPAVSTPLPIFDWGGARRDKAQAQLIEARHQFTQTQRQIIQDVRQATAAHASAQAVLAKVQHDLVPLQDRRREQADAAYRNGLADITTVLLAEQDAQATRAKLIELQQKVSTARVRLVRAVGGAGVLNDIANRNATTQETK